MNVDRQEVQIEVRQHIDYISHDHQEAYELSSQAIYTRLTRYDKISYIDQAGQAVDLKIEWNEGQPRVELRQAYGRMVFDSGRLTQTDYQTPQGRWTLQIATDQIRYDDTELFLDYQVIVGDDPLAHYDYHLKFIDK